MTIENLKEKKFILWLNYGNEGWQPEGFNSIKAALHAEKYSSEWVITKNVDYEIIEKE